MPFSIRGRGLLTRRLCTALCTAGLALQIGCYSYLPVQSQLPTTPQRISITINDRGRVLLAERVAPLLDRIEGRFVSADSTQVVIAISRVVNLRKDASNWTGEVVPIPREAILGFQDKPFSRSRTLAFVGAVVGGLVLLVASISLAVSGTGKPDLPIDPGGER